MSKGGRIAGSTLSFLVGIIMGILVLIIGVAAAAFFIASGTTVYKAQQLVGLDIIEPGSEWGDQTLWNFGKNIYQDYHNLGNLTINDLKKYGIKIPDDVEGIDLTALYEVPFKDMTKDMTGTLQKVLDGITLRTVAEKTGLDIDSMPILKDNADKPVIKAINSIMGSIDSNKMTLRSLADNFNISLGDSEIFKYLENAPLANFGNLINGLPLKVVINADMDYYVKSDTAYPLYKKVADEEKYHEIQKGHELDNFGGDKYIYDFSGEPKTLQYREFRYIKKADGTYQVSYNPYASDWNPEEDDNTYYYSKSYVTYMSTMPTTDVYFKPVENYTVTLDGTNYIFLEADYYPIANVYTKTSTTFNPIAPTASTYTFATGTQYYYKDNDESASEVYGPDSTPFTKETRLNNAGTGYIRIKKGTTEPLPQAIGNLTVNGINDMNSTIDTLRLGDVIQVNAESTRILKTLENTKISGLSSAVDNLYLDEVIDIVYDTYAVDTAGIYVQLPNGRYTLFNPANPDHATLTRYTKTTVGGKVDVGGVMKDVSSQALQALGRSIVKNISDDFKTLAIGDVMDIVPNQYATKTAGEAKVDTTGTTYFRYNDGVYYSLTQAELDALASDVKVYYITTAGTGNAIMRKLAYVAVDAMSGKISGVIDDTYLGEVIDIVYDDYTEDADGIYVKDGKRYVLYNPANPDHAGLTRYSKTPVVGSSSQALQALGNTNIGQISSAFTTLTIGDVMDVTPNKYTGILVAVAKTDATKTYYKYDDGVYLSIDDWTGFDDGDTVYYVSAQGTGNAILRKLAYVKIDDMASKLTPIVDDTLLGEIIDIYPNDIVEEDSTASNYLVEHNAKYTIKDTAGDDVFYAFVLDNKGSYYLDYEMYELATEEQLGAVDVDYYRYVVVQDSELQDLADDFFSGDPTRMASAEATISEYYFLSDSRGEYINSYMFSMYLLARLGPPIKTPYVSGDVLNDYDATSNPGIKKVFYKREACLSTATGAIAYNYYDGGNLWVQSHKSTSVFEQYVTGDPNMAGRDIYYHYLATDTGSAYEGYYIASSEMRELAITDPTISIYTADYSLGVNYTDVSTDYRLHPATYNGQALYVAVSGTEGCYYCNVSDTTVDVPKYNKVYCDTIIIRNGSTDTPVIGYLANINQIRWEDSGHTYHYIDGVDPSKKYAYVQQKSSQVLCAFDKNKVRVGKLGDALKTFTLGDVVSVEPGSILDDSTILSAKLDEISKTLSDKLSNLTVKEVLVWANISSMRPEVKAAIQDLTLNDMFGSFKLDQTSWEIKMDTIKLFNPKKIGS